MKNILNLIIGITFIFANERDGNIGFRYGFLSKPSFESDSIRVLSDSSIIHTGDLLRINIGYLTKTNICVIYKSAGGEFLLLNNKIISDGHVEFLQDTSFFTALSWVDMEPPSGYETFYFINSTRSLSELSKLVKRFNTAPPKGQLKLATQIQKEIDLLDPNMHDDLSSIVSTLDKPITGGVAFRGEDDDSVKDFSITHECIGINGIAFQKIVLDHQ